MQEISFEQEHLAELQHKLALKVSLAFGYYYASEQTPRTHTPSQQDNILFINQEQTTQNRQTQPTLKFTEKEIAKMPKRIQKEFRIEGCTARITVRKSGKNSVCYEIRYRRSGYNVSVSSTDLNVAKEKFIQALHQADKNGGQMPTVPTTFTAFSTYYLENFRKEKVKAMTYKNDIYIFNRWLAPVFQNIPLKRITPLQCKELINNIIAKGYGRTAQGAYNLLSIILKNAIAHGLLERSPLAVINTVRHERTHGTPLTPQEEIQLLSHFNGLERATLAVMLYCGLRPNEVRTAKLNGQFIVAVNSKRKDGKVAYKQIPITPMLLPYMVDFQGVKDIGTKQINKYVKEVLPNHTAKDCRMTFATRCQECGVPADLVRIWMGHTLNSVLGDSYTKFSNSYQLEQAKKVNYSPKSSPKS